MDARGESAPCSRRRKPLPRKGPVRRPLPRLLPRQAFSRRIREGITVPRRFDEAGAAFDGRVASRSMTSRPREGARVADRGTGGRRRHRCSGRSPEPRARRAQPRDRDGRPRPAGGAPRPAVRTPSCVSLAPPGASFCCEPHGPGGGWHGRGRPSRLAPRARLPQPGRRERQHWHPRSNCHGALPLPVRASRRVQSRSAQKSNPRAMSAHVSMGR